MTKFLTSAWNATSTKIALWGFTIWGVVVAIVFLGILGDKAFSLLNWVFFSMAALD
tara:strand:+ start:4237 stop:4404 length:168 start_codon:yes stop_codon:yes gene_type:complete